MEVELAVSVDAGLPFVQATYKLEGEGPLALQCYEVIASLTAAVNMAQPPYPNVLAVSRKLSGGNVQLQQQMLQHAVTVYNLVCCTSRSVSGDVCRFLSLHLKLLNCFPHKRFRR